MIGSPTNQNRLTLLLALGLMLACILGCKSAVWKARVLADKQDHPSKIVSDGSSVFYVTGGTIASRNEGTNNVNQISLKDGSVSVLVKAENFSPATPWPSTRSLSIGPCPGASFAYPKQVVKAK